MKKILTVLVLFTSLQFFAQSDLANKKWKLDYYELNSKKVELKEDEKNNVLYLKSDNTYEFYNKGEVSNGIWHYDAKTQNFVMRSNKNKSSVYEFKVSKVTATDFVIESIDAANGNKVKAYLKS